MSATYTYTQTELDAMLSTFGQAYVNLSQIVVGKYSYGDPVNCKAEWAMMELEIYLYTINLSWTQNANGTTDGITGNKMTQEQLNQMIDACRRLTGTV